MKPIRARSLRRSSGLAICSGYEMRRVQQEYSLPDELLTRIPYPVDTNVWYPVEKNDARRKLGLPLAVPVLIYHGTIDLHVKGLDLLLHAFSELSKAPDLSNTHLLVIGNGKDHQEFRQRIESTRNERIIWRSEWVHEPEELRDYLSAADLYVFPSRADAFGISILEAMACGLPVVAARSRGVPDIFSEGEAHGGCVVPPGDAESLIESIASLLMDRARLQKMGRASLERATSEYSVDRVGSMLRQFLFPELQR
jgi:glycosyltransferase involved in cell wall biosynthesis